MKKQRLSASDIRTILVVGYGSMGRRRIRLCKEIIPEVTLVCVDSNLDRRMKAQEAGHMVVSSLEKAIELSPDIAFVCTSPGHHADIIIPLISAGIHVFTELNLTAERYEEMKRIAEENEVVFFISNTLIYKHQMKMFESAVQEQSKPVVYTYHMGQYLPDWHPWESYKDFFVGEKETSGIREILAIQLPWVIQAFGKIKDISVRYQRCTELEINYPDVVLLSIEHENGNIGSFLVDVASRKATTHLEIIGEDVHIIWDGHNDDLYRMNLESDELEKVTVYETEENIEGYSDIIAEEPYRDEIREFLKVIDGGEMKYGLDDDEFVLGLIDEIEEKYMGI